MLVNNHQKSANLLGLALRAGKLVTGEELVLREIRRQQVVCVVLATDAGYHLTKTIQDKCLYYKIPYLQIFTAAEISAALGRKRSVCGICDQGFAKRLRELCEEQKG